MEELKTKMQRFIAVWREKKFSEDGLMICATICGSEEMHKNYGDTKKAFEKAIELTTEGQKEEIVINKLSKLAKII